MDFKACGRVCKYFKDVHRVFVSSNAHRFDGIIVPRVPIKLSAENEGGRENGSALKLFSAHVAS
jgi:hypothetical protein